MTASHPKSIALAVCLVVLTLGRVAVARTCTWNGSSSTTFTTLANWTCSSGSGPPTSTDTALFTGTPTRSCAITTTTTLAALTMDATFTSATAVVTLSASLTVTGALSIASGTLTGGTTSLTVGSVSQTGGTLTLPSGTTTVGGAFISSGGTFSGSGPVSLTGSGSLSPGAGNTVTNLTIASTGTYTLGSALTATALTISSGTLSPGAFAVQVTGDLTMTGGTFTGGAGTTTVGGNLNLNNSVSTGSDSTLVGYWPLDETASPGLDSSGNGNSVTWTGSPSAITSVPSTITFTDTHSLSMKGTTATYASTSVLSGSTLSELRPSTVTLSAWYKATNVDTNGAEIISGSNTYGLRINSTGLIVMKRISDNTSAADWIEYRVPFTSVLDGNWHQIVGIIAPGTGGSMSAYLDSVVASGTYWVNGTNGATQLGTGTTPTAATAASSAIDWDANTESYGLVIGANPSTSGYQFGANCATSACAIDDVRIYNRALTAAEVAALSHGNQPGGTTDTLSLAGSMSVTGSVTVQSTGTLTLTTGSSLAVGTALTMDGTLNATGGTIKAVSGSYAFKVGSTSTAAPELNINGLAVMNTDSNGMFINAVSGAATTFTRFDSIAFSSGTGTQLLQIYAPSLYLTSNGCTFDGSTTYAIKMSGTGGTGARAIFGNTSCATNDANGICATTEKSDGDANNDGTADVAGTNAAVVQFVRGAQSDTDGTLVGFPTAAFDWNTFSYYSTYAVFHNASSGSDVIYVRDEAGNPLYSWTDPVADETITGTPQWTTDKTTHVHYLYVSANAGSSNNGKVYRLKDTGTGTTSGTLTLDSSWATSGTYSCTCTITSGLSLDASNVYWAATNASGQRLMGITQSGGAAISASWPVTVPKNVTTSTPTLAIAGTTQLYLGVTSSLLQLDVTGATFLQNSNPATITGRVSYGTSLLTATFGTSRIYAGDSSGTMWALSSSNFASPTASSASLWSYPAGSGAITNNTYDASTDTVQFGTANGKVVVLNAATGALLNGYTPTSADPITAAPLYYSGVLVVGTTLGKLYFLDRNSGAASPNAISLIKMYDFGSSQSISTVAMDPTVSRYMVSTSSAANDGRIYYFDLVSDPTPSFQ